MGWYTAYGLILPSTSYPLKKRQGDIYGANGGFCRYRVMLTNLIVDSSLICALDAC